MSDERRHAQLRSVLQIERGIRHVAQHRARRGVLARAATVEQRVADDIAANEDSVEHAVHAGQHVRVRE